MVLLLDLYLLVLRGESIRVIFQQIADGAGPHFYTCFRVMAFEAFALVRAQQPFQKTLAVHFEAIRLLAMTLIILLYLYLLLLLL